MNKRGSLGVRIFCLMLALLIAILSYRSTTAILSLAGRALNPTEGRIPTLPEQVDVRENLPRPARQRLPSRTLQVRDRERNSADPHLRRLAQLQDKAGAFWAASRIRSTRLVPEALHQPQYLNLFLSATPGSPPV
jgi:hypothetical protein